jgi:hypothetical protein
MGMTCCTHGEMTDAYRVPVANVTRRIPLGTSTRRQEDDNFIMDFRRFGYGVCTGIIWFRVVSCVLVDGQTERTKWALPKGGGKTFEL